MNNPLLDKINFPGETYQIPSRGALYTTELAEDVVNGEVTIYPMTTLDEITMKSADMLFSGRAIEEVFSRCIPQVLDVKRMFVKDVDFLMVCLRRVSYGDEVQMTYKHTCENAKENGYVASIGTIINGMKRLDPTTKFTHKLPNGQIVHLNPVRFGDYITLAQKAAEARDVVANPEMLRDKVNDITLSLIMSVDDIDDREFIRQWLSGIKPSWIRNISEKIDKAADWGPTYEWKTKCRDCGEDISITIPLNPIHFFI